MRRFYMTLAACAAAGTATVASGRDITVQEARRIAEHTRAGGAALGDIIRAAEAQLGGTAVDVEPAEARGAAHEAAGHSGSAFAYRVTCLVDGELREVTVDCTRNVRVAEGATRPQGGDPAAAAGNPLRERSADADVAARDADERRAPDESTPRATARADAGAVAPDAVDHSKIEPDAWPPKPGDRNYAAYARYANGDDRPLGQAAQTPAAAPRPAAAPARQALPMDSGAHLLASDVLDRRVVDPRNEDVGHVEDIVADLGDGRVLYTVIETDGFLGLGAELFAVPSEELLLRAERCVVNIPRRAFEQRTGFDRENWPVTAGDGTVADWTTDRADRPVMTWAKLTDLIDADVQNYSGEELGEIEDVVVDPSADAVSYLLLEPDGRSGLVPVPLDALARTSKGDLLLNLSRADLDRQRAFTRGQLPDWSDSEWDRAQRAAFSGARTTMRPR